MYNHAPRGPLLGKRNNINMPGINETLTNSLNKRHRGLPNKTGRVNPDTQQNAISTTAIMLGPPKTRDIGARPDTLYAPMSANELANTPCRGDWAVAAAECREWTDQVVTSGLNTYSNAIPVFTNMGGVKKGTKIRFAGLVGNAGMGKQGDASADNFGQVYSAGALSGMNTGPEYIPPLSTVYLSPYPYVRKDPKTGKDYPGFENPGWPAGCDKYQPATHALRDTDVPAFFHHVEKELDDFASRCVDNTAFNTGLQARFVDLGIHEHLPIMLYARTYAPMARAKVVMAKLKLKQNDALLRSQAVGIMLDVITRNARYWQAVEREQHAVTNALGGPEWNTRLDSLTTENSDLNAHADYAKLLETYSGLLISSMDIWKMQFAEQQNFMRSLCFGKSRYGSASEGILDIMVGYRV